jgi:hypothetical protein
MTFIQPPQHELKDPPRRKARRVSDNNSRIK